MYTHINMLIALFIGIINFQCLTIIIFFIREYALFCFTLHLEYIKIKLFSLNISTFGNKLFALVST